MMTSTEMKKLANLITSVDNTQDLNRVIELVKNQQRMIRSKKAAVARSVLTVGTRVKITSKAGVEYGSINEIRRTKATVTINGIQYNCPLSILEAA